MIPTFRFTALAAGAVCLSLALVWIVWPHFLPWLWALETSTASEVLARRNGALFLGVGLLLVMVKDTRDAVTIRAVGSGMAVGCSVLALLGIAESVAGHVGVLIWLAVGVELLLATMFVLVLRHAAH